MPARSTNLALLALTVSAVLSGFAAFALGTPPGRWVVVAHGVIGLAILVLAPPKTMIARRGLARHDRGRWLSVGLSVTVTATIGSGFGLITGLADRIGPITMMQLHVGAGLVTLALIVAHLVMRPVRPRTTDLNRRNALRSAGVVGVAGLVYVAVEGVLELTGASGAERRFTGSHDIGPDTALPPTQWLNDRVQRVERESYVVGVAGREHTFSDLDGTGDVVEATLDCTGGWHATRSWSGTRLDRLVDGLDGESLVVRSLTGYWRRFPLQHADRLWLATRVDGDLLPAGNGAPVRLVAPNRRGYWWVKWVETVEIDGLPPWWQPPLPMA